MLLDREEKKHTLLVNVLLVQVALLLAQGAEHAAKQVAVARVAGVLVGRLLGVVKVEAAEEAGKAAGGF